MRWLRRDIWKADIFLAGLLLVLVLMMLIPMSASAYGGISGLTTAGTVQGTPTVDLTVTALQKEQLTQQVRQLDNWWLYWLYNGSTALIAAVTAILVAFIGLYQWRGNQNAERKKEVDAQEKELRDRAEERFKSAVTALGDENEATQVGGAILLRSFLNKEDAEIYERYYTQIFDLAVAYLRPSNASPPSSDNTPALLTTLRHALVVVLRESYPLVRQILMDQKKTEFDPLSLDASHICLDGAYLVASDLKNIWMADATLIEAKLGRAKFHKADLRRAIIRKALLNRADLSEATLFQANFSDADLSGVDLRCADLRGVKFKGSILTSANLSGADLGGFTIFGEAISAANIEAAQSLKDTNLRVVKGLTKEQLEICKAKGAIVDEDTSSPPTERPQNDNASVPPVSTSVGNTPPSQPDAKS